MNLGIFLYNLSLFAVVFALAFVSFRRARRVGSSLFFSYASYLIASGLAGFICNFGRSLIALSVQKRPLNETAVEFSSEIIIAVSVPLIAVGWHFFVQMIVRLADAPPSRGLRVLYLACLGGAAVSFMVLTWSLVSSPSTGTSFIFRAGYFFVNVLGIALISVALGWIMVKSGSWTDAAKRRTVRTYGWISILFLLLAHGSSFLPHGRPLWVGFYLTMHFAKLFVPFAFLLLSYRHWMTDIDGARFQAGLSILAAGQFALSRREREVAALMLEGKDNDQIHRELFISKGTVKNHVSNIYKKLGIRSRLQLMNLVRAPRNAAGDASTEPK